MVKHKIYTIYLHYAHSFDNLVSKFSPGFFTATQQAYVPPSMRGQNMPTRKLHEYEPPSNLKQQQQQPGRSGLYIQYNNPIVKCCQKQTRTQNKPTFKARLIFLSDIVNVLAAQLLLRWEYNSLRSRDRVLVA